MSLWTVFLLAGCNWLNQGTGKLTLARISSGAQTPTITKVQAGAIALGDGIATELASNLINAGLTVDEAQIIVASTKAEVNIAAGQIAIETLSLVDQNPLLYIAGPAVRGAISALNEPGVNLTDASRRAMIAQVIMQSTVGSLGGRTEGLSTDAVLSLQKDMVGSGIRALNDGGLGGDEAVSAVKAITSGAAASLSKSVDSASAARAAASIVSGAVENLGSAGIPADSMQNLVGSAVEGVVAQLSKTGVSDAGEAASLVAKSSVESLKSLALPIETIIKATEGAAKGAVSALTAAGVSKEAIASTAQRVAQSSASALKSAGVPDDSIGKAAGAIASGAIQGLSAAGLTTAEITASKSISGIVSGASMGVAEGGIAREKITSALGDVAGTAITAITKLDSAKVDVSSLKNQIVSEVVQSTIAAAISSGVATSATISSVTASIASGAGKALAIVAKAGVTVDNAATAIQTATQSALVTDKVKMGMSDATISSVASTAGQTAQASQTSETHGTSSGALALCSSAFSDTMTDTAFRSLVEPMATPPACQKGANALCPKNRTYAEGMITWIALPETNICQFITPKTGSLNSVPPLLQSCTDFVGTGESLDWNDLESMESEAHDSNMKSCRKSTLSQCPEVAASLPVELRYRTFSYAFGADTICAYRLPISCSKAFQDNISRSGNTLLASTVSNDLGDMECMVPPGITSQCPALLSEAQLYETSESATDQTGPKLCHYQRRDSDCPEDFIPVTPTVANAMTPVAKGDTYVKSCRMPYFARFGFLDRHDPSSPLVQNGTYASVEGIYTGTRLILRKRADACPAPSAGASFSLADIDRIPMFENMGKKACDIASGTTCPALDTTAQSDFSLFVENYANPQRTRCFYSPKSIPACPSTLPEPLSTAGPQTLRQMHFYSENFYLCDVTAGFCPAAPAESTTYLASNPAEGPQRCIYSVSSFTATPASDVMEKVAGTYYTSLNYPTSMIKDGSGNLYIVDQGRHILLKVSASDQSTQVIAGTFQPGFSGDGGPAHKSMLHSPSALALDSAGDLYIADLGNHRIRKVNHLTGTIQTIAGIGNDASSGDGGLATNADIGFVHGLAIDATGNIYISESNFHRVRKINPAGIITTVAGTGEPGFGGDAGPALEASLSSPMGMSVDALGNLFIADLSNRRIRKVTALNSVSPTISTVAGSGAIGVEGDGGPATSAGFYSPWSVAVDESGALFVADMGAYRVRKVALDGTITTIAGNGSYGSSGDGGPASAAAIGLPLALYPDSNGTLLLSAFHSEATIRKVDLQNGTIATALGVPPASPPDLTVPENIAVFKSPVAMAADAMGRIFIADSKDHVIRRINVDGSVTKVAGTGEIGFLNSNPLDSTFSQPSGLAVDASGNLYIADTGNNKIRRLSLDGSVTTVAGSGYPGQTNGDASTATFSGPTGLVFDDMGNLLIADSGNGTIRKLTLTDGSNSVSTLVSNLGIPTGLAFQGGKLYIADMGQHLIRMLDPLTET